MVKGISALGCGATGGLVMAAVLLEAGRRIEGGLVGLALAGAALAGVVTARCFGAPGRWGWVEAGLGAVLATSLGASLAVAIFLPLGLEVLLAGPVFVWSSILQHPVVGAVWGAGMCATHLAARRYSLK